MTGGNAVLVHAVMIFAIFGAAILMSRGIILVGNVSHNYRRFIDATTFAFIIALVLHIVYSQSFIIAQSLAASSLANFLICTVAMPLYIYKNISRLTRFSIVVFGWCIVPVFTNANLEISTSAKSTALGAAVASIPFAQLRRPL